MAFDSLFYVAKCNLGKVKHEPMQPAVTLFAACDLQGNLIKVPMSPNFLYFHSKGHIKKRTSAKKFFDLNETRFFNGFLKTLKSTAILAHHSSQSSHGDSGLVT